MKAITLKQPWAWAVANAGKRIENRTWKPTASMIGQRIAIHAGARSGYDLEGSYELADILHYTMGLRQPGRSNHVYGAIVATAVIDGVVDDDDSVWFCGPFGWVLRDVVTLKEPVPCKGALGLWTAPDAVLRAIGGER